MSMTSKDRYDANERKIDARLERITFQNRALEVGDSAYATWPERRAKIAADLGENEVRLIRYMNRRAPLGAALVKDEDRQELRRLKEKVAKLQREIDAKVQGTTLVKARRYEAPATDFYG